MIGFIQRLIPDGLKRAIAYKIARWLGTLVAGVLSAYLVKHLGVSLDLANLVGDDLNKLVVDGGTAAILGGLALLFSVKDAKKVDTEIKQASVSALPTGTVVHLPDGEKVTVGKPSPEGQTDAQERAETAALNVAQLHRRP